MKFSINLPALLLVAGLLAASIVLNAQWLIQVWILLALLLGAFWTLLDSRGKNWSRDTYKSRFFDRVLVAFQQIPIFPIICVYPLVVLLSCVMVRREKAGRAKT